MLIPSALRYYDGWQCEDEAAAVVSLCSYSSLLLTFLRSMLVNLSLKFTQENV